MASKNIKIANGNQIGAKTQSQGHVIAPNNLAAINNKHNPERKNDCINSSINSLDCAYGRLLAHARAHDNRLPLAEYLPRLIHETGQ